MKIRPHWSFQNLSGAAHSLRGARDKEPSPALQVHLVAPPLVAWALQRLIQNACPHIALAGCSRNLDEALSLLERQPPDVVVLDLDDGYGADDIARLYDAARLKVLALSSRAEAGFLGAVLDASVRGFLQKREVPSMLLRGIEAVGTGEVFVSASAMERLLVAAAQQAAQRAARAPHPDDIRLSRLSASELQTIAAVTANVAQPVNVIADRLCIGEQVLRGQLTSIYSKLGVFGRVGLCAYGGSASTGRATPGPVRRDN